MENRCMVLWTIHPTIELSFDVPVSQEGFNIFLFYNRVFIRHLRSENYPFTMQNSAAKHLVAYDYFLFRWGACFKILCCNAAPFSCYYLCRILNEKPVTIINPLILPWIHSINDFNILYNFFRYVISF